MDLALPSLIVTMFWFLGCMNIWNLIDGMDGLASGVGLLVSGTLTLVAIHSENFQAAILSVALAGSLAGFLLYNWHPACIFLGDSGRHVDRAHDRRDRSSRLDGRPLGDLDPFPDRRDGPTDLGHGHGHLRRWVRNLPLSAADRRHVHHLLIGLGLNPRQAALMLYCFSAFFAAW